MECYIRCEDYEGIARCFELLAAMGHEYFFIEKLPAVAQVSLIDQVAERFSHIYSILSWAAFNEGRAQDMARYANLYYLNHPRIVQTDPRLQLNISLVCLIDFRVSLNALIEAGNAGAIPASFLKMLYLKILESPGYPGGLTSGQLEQPQKYTEKQKTVMGLLCEGKSYREIAQVMGIKLPTLRSHLALIYKKLDVTNELDAVKKIRLLGLDDEMPAD